jgi:hypothetical protein
MLAEGMSDTPERMVMAKVSPVSQRSESGFPAHAAAGPGNIAAGGGVCIGSAMPDYHAGLLTQTVTKFRGRLPLGLLTRRLARRQHHADGVRVPTILLE